MCSRTLPVLSVLSSRTAAQFRGFSRRVRLAHNLGQTDAQTPTLRDNLAHLVHVDASYFTQLFDVLNILPNQLNRVSRVSSQDSLRCIYHPTEERLSVVHSGQSSLGPLSSPRSSVWRVSYLLQMDRCRGCSSSERRATQKADLDVLWCMLSTRFSVSACQNNAAYHSESLHTLPAFHELPNRLQRLRCCLEAPFDTFLGGIRDWCDRFARSGRRLCVGVEVFRVNRARTFSSTFPLARSG